MGRTHGKGGTQADRFEWGRDWEMGLGGRAGWPGAAPETRRGWGLPKNHSAAGWEVSDVQSVLLMTWQG